MNNTDHPLLLESMRRTRRAFLTAAIVTLPFGVFCLLAPWWSSEGRGVTIACAALGALSFAVGLFAARMTARYWHPNRAPLMSVLRDHAAEIVWIYEQQVTSQAGGIALARAHNFRLHLASGQCHTLSVAGRDREAMLSLLAEIAPRARFGYSRELARQFKRDPRSLALAAR
jgi:hypothetical protein